MANLQAKHRKLRLNWKFSVTVIALITLFCIIGALILQIHEKDKAIEQLKKDVAAKKSQLTNKQQTLKDIAFYVHPESEYEEYRREAYAKLYKATFPELNTDKRKLYIVRVFNTDTFKKADPFFSDIQNDDLILYDFRHAVESDNYAIAIARPREQKILAHTYVAEDVLKNARLGNEPTATPIKGPPLNYFSLW